MSAFHKFLMDSLKHKGIARERVRHCVMRHGVVRQGVIRQSGVECAGGVRGPSQMNARTLGWSH